MYRYKIKGSDHQKGEVRRVGKAIAVIVPKDWEGADVLVVKAGDIEEFVKMTMNELMQEEDTIAIMNQRKERDKSGKSKS